MRPILCAVNGHTVGSYGVLVASGYLLGIFWLMTQRERVVGTVAEMWALFYTLFLSAVLGAKLAYVLLTPGPIARVGYVFWGGFAASMLAGWVFQQVYNRLYRPRRYLQVADYFGAALAMGHVLGRVGCFLRGCCHGRPTALPWGVTFDSYLSAVKPDWLGVPLHPTQLYEAFGEAAIAAALVFHVLPGVRKGRYTYGAAFLGYIVAYSLLRFAGEFFRGDHKVFFGPFSPSQWASLAGLAVAGGLLWRQGIVERHAKTRSIYLR